MGFLFRIKRFSINDDSLEDIGKTYLTMKMVG